MHTYTGVYAVPQVALVCRPAVAAAVFKFVRCDNINCRLDDDSGSDVSGGGGGGNGRPRRFSYASYASKLRPAAVSYDLADRRSQPGYGQRLRRRSRSVRDASYLRGQRAARGRRADRTGRVATRGRSSGPRRSLPAGRSVRRPVGARSAPDDSIGEAPVECPPAVAAVPYVSEANHTTCCQVMPCSVAVSGVSREGRRLYVYCEAVFSKPLAVTI